MKNNSLFLFTSLFLFLIISASCKKDMETTIEGKVIDNLNQPVDRAIVYIGNVRRDGPLMGGGYYRTNTSAITNGNGEFTFQFEADENLSYGIQAEKEKYITDPSQWESINRGKENKVTLMLTPEAWLKIHVKNVNKIYDCIGAEETFCGKNIDTSFKIRVFGNTKKVLYIALYPINGNWDTYKQQNDTIYCPAFDTTLHTINY